MNGMSEHDPAFLWETEAIRSASHRRVEAETDTSNAGAHRWNTLREASRQTGIPVETLRKWARRGRIPTYLEPTDHGSPLRMVDLDGIETRAIDIGRQTTGRETIGRDTSSEAGQQPHTKEAELPQGSMIVPIDAWSKMLNQLGNLHEAGQQLAAARERAARAETEATFLRERLAEMREQTERPRERTPRDDEPAPAAVTTIGQQRMWDYVIRRLRNRRQG